MCRYLLLIIGLAGTISSACAQDSPFLMNPPARAVIKWAPLSLLDPDATVQFGLEYRTGPRTSVQGELGYGWNGLALTKSGSTKYNLVDVWRIRSEVRFYSGRYRTNRRLNMHIRSAAPYGNYRAIDALFKTIAVHESQPEYILPDKGTWLVRSGRTFTRPIQRTVFGIGAKFGRQFPLIDRGRESRAALLMDIYIGAGIRYTVNQKGELPPNPLTTCGCGLYDRFSKEESAIQPSLTAGVKLGLIRLQNFYFRSC